MPDVNYNPGNQEPRSEPMGPPPYTPPTQQWAPMSVIPPKKHTVRNVLLIVVAGLVGLCGIGTIIAAASSQNKPSTVAAPVFTDCPFAAGGCPSATVAAAVPAASKAASPTPAATTKAAAPPATTKAAPPPPAPPKLTVSQQQALGDARDYLNVEHFSRTGLIKQLQFDGYSAADATYAADAVGADWMAEAAGAAADYLKVEHFSHSGLVKQLEFDGFTAAEAEHGTTSVGL